MNMNSPLYILLIASSIFLSCSSIPTKTTKEIVPIKPDNFQLAFGLDCTALHANDINLKTFFEIKDGRNKPSKGHFSQKYKNISGLLTSSAKKNSSKINSNFKFIQSGSSKYRITETSIHFMDGNAISSKNQVISLANTIKNECDFSSIIESKAEEEDEDERNSINANYENRYDIASIVGPYVSVHQNYEFFKGGMRPTVCESIINRNFSNLPSLDSDEEINDDGLSDILTYNLFDISNETDIFEALKNNEFVQKTLGHDILKSTELTSSILSQLRDKFQDSYEINIPKDDDKALSQIAIYDYDELTNKMHVILGFDNGCYSIQSNFTQLDLKLAPKPQFEELLKAEIATAAAQGRKPYFMRYSQQLK